MKAFSPKEAEGRIPHVLKSITLTAIECMTLLDNHSVRSRRIEAEVMALQGYVAHLLKLSYIVWKAPKSSESVTE